MEEKKKNKLPTPIKRHKQDEKKEMRNRIWKSKIHTARIAFGKLADESQKKTALQKLYALMDKAVKQGVFKKNKAARLKSRAASKV